MNNRYCLILCICLAGGLSRLSAADYATNFTALVDGCGRGAISFTPAITNGMVEIGRSYTLKAVARAGSVFSQWEILRNAALITNKAPSFVLSASNAMTVRAIFKDTTKPTLTLSAPVNNSRLTNGLVSVQGKAGDANLAGVYVVLNDGVPTAAGAMSNWQTQVTVKLGTNSVKAYSVDTCNNTSPVSRVSFVYAPKAPLTVTVGSGGTVMPNLNNTWQEVGKSLTLTAKPAAGMVVSNWTDTDGNLLATGNACTLVMASNLAVTVSFAPNPWTPFKGDYHGLFMPQQAPLDPNSTNTSFHTVASTNAGMIKLTLTTQGAVSGQLLMMGGTYPLSGGFGADGQAKILVPRTGKPPILATLAFDFNQGIIAGGVAEATAWESVVNLQPKPAVVNSPLAATYTMDIEPDLNFSTNHLGSGAASFTVSKTGTVQLTGTLPDGSAFSQGAALLTNGWWPVFAPLYGGKGLLLGWMDHAQWNGNFYWQKPPNAKDAILPGGVSEITYAWFSPYFPPAPKTSVTGWELGTICFFFGNLPVPNGPREADNAWTYSIQVTNSLVRVLAGPTNKLTLTINAASGQLNGTILHPVTGKSTPYKGTLVKFGTDAYGAGWFLGPSESGGVSIDPQ
ncbi:MAG: hypothetical protein WCO56_05885 [Verrucomicrobiota bacterium]